MLPDESIKSWTKGEFVPFKNLREMVLAGFLCLFSLLFIISLFKNISYPLFWADESMTVMHGARVLEYGYPKVHDGKNVLYDLRHSNPTLGTDEKTDAYIGGANWGMYYFATIGIKLAETSDDIFTKTAIIRTTFALAGLVGLALTAFLATHFFSGALAKMTFLVIFAFFELLSVPLVLHLREARYYSLNLLLTALFIFVYTYYRILNRTGHMTYTLFSTLLLWLVFVTFSPAYFILVVSVLVFESLLFAQYFFQRYLVRLEWRDLPAPRLKMPFFACLKGLLPLLLSLAGVAPLLSFFRIFSIAEEMAKFNATSIYSLYLDNSLAMWRYCASFEYIYLAMFLKICLILLAVLPGKELFPSDKRRGTFSNFLTVIFIVYFLAVAKIPNFPFTRYFIPLQPILAVIIILDLATVYYRISLRQTPGVIYRKVILFGVAACLFFYTLANNGEFIEGHVYELSHRYQGPLDQIIPFIKQKYANTDNLIIATNYEETSFMYYLGSRVIVGFVGNNLEQDAQAVPDIIIYRKGWGNFGDVFNGFLQRQRYERISFPVFDRQVNNIPELNPLFIFPHQFKTLESGHESAKTDIYLKAQKG